MKASELPIHPIALLLPPLSEEEYSRMVQSIGDAGLIVPGLAWTDPDKQTWLVDGVHRRRACMQVGKEFRVDHLETSVDRMAEIVMAAHVGRRHMDAATRDAYVVALTSAKIKCGASLGQAIAQTAEALHISPRTVGEIVRDQHEATAEEAAVDFPFTPPTPIHPDARAALGEQLLKYDRFLNQIDALPSTFRLVQQTLAGAAVDWIAVEHHLQSVKRILMDARPDRACQECQGHKCPVCLNRGFWTAKQARGL